MSGPGDPVADVVTGDGTDASGEGGGPHRPTDNAVFTLEGRAAPGLYLVGWLATVMGVGIVLVGLMAGGGTSAAVVALCGVAILAIGLAAATGAQTMQRGRDAGRAYRGPSPFLAFATSLPLTILLVVLVVAPAAALGLDAASPAASLLSILATAAVYIGLVRLFVVGPGALSWREMGMGPLGSAAIGEFARGALFALPVVVVTSLFAAILVQLVGTSPNSPLPTSGPGPGLVFNLISAAVVAPISEEIFFRGFATTAWSRDLGSRAALVRGTFFFALIHILTMGGSSFGDAAGRAFVAFAARLPVSFALGWVFLQRRSIYASIGLHAAFNGLLVLLAELVSRSVGG